MVQVNSQETFVYECGDSGNKIFPIDYSLREISQGSKDMSQLLSTKAFHTTLTKMVLAHADDYSKRPEELKGSPAVPVETKLFFEEILKLYRDPTCAEAKQLALNDLDGRINQTPQEIIDSFIYQLFQRLCDRVSTSDSSEAAFVRHVLMDDPVFSATVLDKLWKTELQPRIDRIKDFAKGVSSDKQLMYLQWCLSILDTISFGLNYDQTAPLQSKQNESDAFELQHVLEELLSERSRCKRKSNLLEKQSGQIYAKYSLDNIAVGKNSMEEVFTDNKILQTNRELARAAYLKNLKSKRSMSKFEEDYLKLREYLDSSKLQIGEDTLNQAIEDRCRQVCIAKMKELIGAYQPEIICDDASLPQNKYLTVLIDNTINSEICSKLAQFQDLHNIFWTYNQVGPQMEMLFHAVLTTTDKTFENVDESLDHFCLIRTLQSVLNRINELPIFVWNTLYANGNDIPTVDNTTYFKNSKLIAEHLANDTIEAIKYFGVKLISPISRDGIQKVIDSYMEAIQPFNTAKLWKYFKDYTEQIYYAILLINLHRIVQDIKPKLMERTRFFVDTLTAGNFETQHE